MKKILLMVILICCLPCSAQFSVGLRSFSSGSYPTLPAINGSFVGVPISPTISLRYNIAANVGDTLFLSFYSDQTVTVSSVVDSHSQTFTQLLNYSSGVYNVSLWYVLSSASPIIAADTYTVTASSSIAAGHFAFINAAYSGVVSFGTTNQGCGTSTSFTDTLTTVANYSTVSMSVFAQQPAGSFTLSMSGSTSVLNNNNASSPYWIENENVRGVSTAGSTSATGTLSASVDYCFASAELRSQ